MTAKFNDAKTIAEADSKLSFSIEHDFGFGIGQGFTVPGKSGMSHPISDLPLSDVPIATPPLSKVKAYYVRDSPTSDWYLLTMYPD